MRPVEIKPVERVEFARERLENARRRSGLLVARGLPRTSPLGSVLESPVVGRDVARARPVVVVRDVYGREIAPNQLVFATAHEVFNERTGEVSLHAGHSRRLLIGRNSVHAARPLLSATLVARTQSKSTAVVVRGRGLVASAQTFVSQTRVVVQSPAQTRVGRTQTSALRLAGAVVAASASAVTASTTTTTSTSLDTSHPRRVGIDERDTFMPGRGFRLGSPAIGWNAVSHVIQQVQTESAVLVALPDGTQVAVTQKVTTTNPVRTVQFGSRYSIWGSVTDVEFAVVDDTAAVASTESPVVALKSKKTISLESKDRQTQDLFPLLRAFAQLTQGNEIKFTFKGKTAVVSLKNPGFLFEALREAGVNNPEGLFAPLTDREVIEFKNSRGASLAHVLKGRLAEALKEVGYRPTVVAAFSQSLIQRLLRSDLTGIGEADLLDSAASGARFGGGQGRGGQEEPAPEADSQ